MDEPTSVLTPQEVEILFATLRKLAARGHRDPLHLAQAGRDPRAVRRMATILRRGKVVAHLHPGETSAASWPN